jgi:hypothetical protein
LARGQINAVSFLLSMIFYSIVITLLVGWVATEQKNMAYASNRSALWAAGTSITDMLAKSGGVPLNWETNASSVQAIGLATTANNLSVAKVNAFVALNYNTSRTALGLPGTTNYYFTITNMSGTLLNQSGVDSNSSGTALVFTRYAILNGSRVWLRLKMYQ